MKIATHNGPFHADEVFATVVLQEIYPDAELIRTRDREILKECDIVYDVGGICDLDMDRFDHHMKDYGVTYENGIKLSSFGLVWRKYGEQFCEGNQELADLIRDKLVMAIDALDNGQELFTLSSFEVQPITIDDIVKSFYPTEDEEQAYQDAFFKALEFAGALLKRLRLSFTKRLEKRQKFEELASVSEDKQFLILDEPLPFSDSLANFPELLYVIMPRPSNNDYSVRAVPVAEGSFSVRKKLPDSWAGLEGAELERVSSIKGAKFCHSGRWLCATNSKEAAVAMVKMALK